MAASIAELQKAMTALSESLERIKQKKDEVDYKINRDACIQRFEFCFELSWKISMKVLGIVEPAPKPALREMARNSLIEDFDLWLSFLDARNKSSHTYDEDMAKMVLEVSKSFLPEGLNLLKKLSIK